MYGHDSWPYIYYYWLMSELKWKKIQTKAEKNSDWKVPSYSIFRVLFVQIETAASQAPSGVQKTNYFFTMFDF